MSSPDVLAAQIWELLWFTASAPENRVSLHIAETVLFKNRLPYRWYFTSAAGEIRRKNRSNCSAAAIEAARVARAVVGHDLPSALLRAGDRMRG